jgi:MFS family permease
MGLHPKRPPRPSKNNGDHTSGTVEPVPASLRRNRDFRLLWISQLVATLGTEASLVAFPLLVLVLTGSPFQATVVGFATYFALLVYLPAGIVADRFDRRRVMVLTALVRGVALLSLPVTVALGAGPSFPQLLAVAFVQASAGEMFAIVEQSALANVVAADQLPQAVAQNEVRRSVAVLGGPPVGGLLFGLGRTVPFLASGAASLGAAFALLGLRGPLQPERAVHTRQSPRIQVLTGFRWLLSHPFVRGTSLAAAATNVTWGALDIVLIVRARESGASAGATGLMIALIGLGGITGTALVGLLRRRYPDGPLVIGVFAFEAVALPLLTLTRNALVMGVIGGVAALGGATWNSIVVAARIRLAPAELTGQVNAAARFIASSVFPFGLLASGAVMSAYGSTWALVCLVAWQVCLALAAARSKHIRNSGVNSA